VTLIAEMWPPIGVLVRFKLKGSPVITLHGCTAQLGSIGPRLYCETVIVTAIPRKVYLCEEVEEWEQVGQGEDNWKIFMEALRT
jgi:hypothetical protein